MLTLDWLLWHAYVVKCDKDWTALESGIDGISFSILLIIEFKPVFKLVTETALEENT